MHVFNPVVLHSNNINYMYDWIELIFSFFSKYFKDVTGSKASLISKDTKGSGTPRKKVKKKKKPASTTGTPREEDEWADTLTAELQTIHEDVVSPSGKKGQDEGLSHPFSTEATVLKSQPLEKLFIETDSK